MDVNMALLNQDTAWYGSAWGTDCGVRKWDSIV